jgi:hypothetical protein
MAPARSGHTRAIHTDRARSTSRSVDVDGEGGHLAWGAVFRLRGVGTVAVGLESTRVAGRGQQRDDAIRAAPQAVTP